MFQTEKFGCSRQFEGNLNIDKFCEAIRELCCDHISLRAQMERLEYKIKQLTVRNQTSLVSDFHELLEIESKFKSELEIHSKKEEEGLFVLVGLHIGTESGPIAVMEFEHNEARRILELFELQSRDVGDSVTSIEAKSSGAILLKAIQILYDHFYKEENVLFPLAENGLTLEEKEQLLEGIRN